MKRDVTRQISNFLDFGLPPWLRENRFFYGLVLGRAVKSDVHAYMDFRDRAWKMTDQEMQAFYARIQSNIDRPTDCNKKSIQRVLRGIRGGSVLEFGCGRGYLAQKILKKHKADYTGIDFNIETARQNLPSSVTLVEGVDESGLKTGEKFDTVISTHVLEHVKDVRTIFASLWERTLQRLIIVVPLQINFRYTPDLHLRYWRRPGDFFLDCGLDPKLEPEFWIDGGDLCVFIDR